MTSAIMATKMRKISAISSRRVNVHPCANNYISNTKITTLCLLTLLHLSSASSLASESSSNSDMNSLDSIYVKSSMKRREDDSFDGDTGKVMGINDGNVSSINGRGVSISGLGMKVDLVDQETLQDDVSTSNFKSVGGSSSSRLTWLYSSS